MLTSSQSPAEAEQELLSVRWAWGLVLVPTSDGAWWGVFSSDRHQLLALRSTLCQPELLALAQQQRLEHEAEPTHSELPPRPVDVEALGL